MVQRKLLGAIQHHGFGDGIPTFTLGMMPNVPLSGSANVSANTALRTSVGLVMLT